jgi:pyruvate dehydrogenase E2 component (dihydrolipoamide acetyltransferase)
VRVEVKMANLGYDMQTGTVVRWLRQVGDHVSRGEPIAEIETEKTTIEMEVPHSGKIVEIVASEGVEVPVGDVIALMEVDA